MATGCAMKEDMKVIVYCGEMGESYGDASVYACEVTTPVTHA